MTGEIERALERVARMLATEELAWALTGSAGHALQGAELEPGDLDVRAYERLGRSERVAVLRSLIQTRRGTG